MPISRKQIFFLFLFAGILIFWGNSGIYLWNQDEAAYAGFGLNIWEGKNWLIPDFPWSDVHRKTPLHFWFIAISYFIFGVNEFAVRFSSAVAILATLSVIFFWGKRIWGEKRMFVSCFVLLSSILFVSIAKIAVTDATLLFFETVTALCLALYITFTEKKWVYIFWAAIAMGMLTKGPPIVIFSGSMGLLLLIFHPDGKRIWKFKPFLFFPISLIPLFLWGYFAWQQDGGKFISWLIDWYILRRVEGSVFGQTGPPGYYVAIFLGSFLIWLPFVIPTILSAFRRKAEKSALIWAAWLIGAWFIYEFISSKLPAYTIAAHPALAIGLSTFLVTPENFSWIKKIKWIYLILAFLMCGVIGWLIVGPEFMPEGFRIWPLVFAFVILIGILISIFWAIHSEKLLQSLKFILPASLIFNFLLWSLVVPQTQPFLNGHDLIISYMKEKKLPKSATVLLSHSKGKPPSLPFYIEKDFPNLKFEADTIKVFEAWYNTPAPSAFILSRKQLSVIERLTDSIEAKEIITRQIDRQNTNSYFVVIKE